MVGLNKGNRSIQIFKSRITGLTYLFEVFLVLAGERACKIFAFEVLHDVVEVGRHVLLIPAPKTNQTW